jgi:hypothetical protein
MNNTQPIWPKAGDEVIFKGCPAVYYPHFTNMKTFCDKNLAAGETYTLAEVNILSSWVAVYLVGYEKEMLNWAFFKPVEK